MPHVIARAVRPRGLSERERSFTRWLIEHAQVGEEERTKFLGQLEAATVVRICECGCASIDFAIAGVAPQPGVPLSPFGDFIARDKRFGVFVFSKHGTLAGVEIYSLADLSLPAEFPSPSELVALEEANQSPQRNAGSRPPSGDSQASETPSSLGPRG